MARFPDPVAVPVSASTEVNLNVIGAVPDDSMTEKFGDV